MSVKIGFCLPGGGGHGGTQAGMIAAAEKLGVFPTHVSGTSVGAVNAAGVAMWSPNREFHRKGREAWLKLTNKRVRRSYGLGMLFEGARYSSAPLREYLNEVVDVHALRASPIEAFVTAVNVTSGLLEWKAISGPYMEDNPVDWIMRSAAFPLGLTPEYDRHGDMFLDGGLREPTPVQALIDAECDEIYILDTTPLGVGRYGGDKFPLTLGMRCLEIMADEIREGDVAHIRQRCRKHNILHRHIVPTATYGTALDFSTELNNERFAHGAATFTRWWTRV